LEDNFEFVKRRRWTEICSLWAAHLPRPKPSGAPPDSELLISPAFTEVISTGVEDLFTTNDLESIKPLIMHQGIFLAHKANYFASRAINLVKVGRPTLGATTAYQSAMFSARAITRWLGVTVWRHPNGGRNFIIDSWPCCDGRKTEEQLTMVCEWKSFQARNTWDLYIRLTRVTKDLDWGNLLHKVFIKNNEKVSWQRNGVHYIDHAWLYEDLFADEMIISKESLSREKLENNKSVKSNVNFSLQFCLLMKSGLDKLFADLAGSFPIINQEYELYVKSNGVDLLEYNYMGD